MVNELKDLRDGGWGLGEVLRLSWPASLTMLNSTIIRFVDGLMVSRVGPEAMGAQLLAGMWSFVFESFAVGCLTVVNTYVAQNFGAGNLRRTASYAWGGVLLALVFAALAAPLALVARPLFSAFQQPGDPAAPLLVDMEVMYFRYMVLSMAFTLSARPLEQFFFGVHRPGVVLATSLAANAFNFVANLVLIFGLLGFPAMGLEGAAIGSVTAWGLQLLMLLAVFLRPSMHRRFFTRMVRAVRLRHALDLLKLGWPAGMQLANDVLCWSLLLAWLVSRYFGPLHLAASTVAIRYMGLSFMPAGGIGVAVTALVGKHIGAGRHDLAQRRTYTALLTAMVYMGLCGVAFYIWRYQMVRLFVHTPGLMDSLAGPETIDQIVEVGSIVLVMAAVFQLFDAVGIVFLGALRGAGDTFWPMVITLVLSWLLVVGAGWVIAEAAPHWGSVGPWLAASLYVVALGVVLALRFQSGAWRRIHLVGPTSPTSPTLMERAPTDAPTATPPPPPDPDDPPDTPIGNP